MKPSRGGKNSTYQMISMPDELHAKVVEEAKRQGRSIAGMIRYMAKHYVDHRVRKEQGDD